MNKIVFSLFGKQKRRQADSPIGITRSQAEREQQLANILSVTTVPLFYRMSQSTLVIFASAQLLCNV